MSTGLPQSLNSEVVGEFTVLARVSVGATARTWRFLCRSHRRSDADVTRWWPAEGETALLPKPALLWAASLSLAAFFFAHLLCSPKPVVQGTGARSGASREPRGILGQTWARFCTTAGRRPGRRPSGGGPTMASTRTSGSATKSSGPNSLMLFQRDLGSDLTSNSTSR